MSEQEQLAASTPPPARDPLGSFREGQPDPLGSFREGPTASPVDPILAEFDASEAAFRALSKGVEVVRMPDGRAVTAGRPTPSPA